MKILYIIRHAKSSWENPKLSDFDRPLNERGKQSIKVMGNFLKKNSENFDAVVSSPAVRALKTAKRICKAVEFKKENIRKDPSIYHASTGQLLLEICRTEDRHGSLALFGHNPGLTDLINYLTDKSIGNLPTCGVAKIAFELESWAEITKGSGECIYIHTPKKEGLHAED